MTVIGFHCSHEQIAPAQLLKNIQHAERAGFTAGMSSDHFSPWSERQGESGFAWAFLGAALATTSLPFGVVNAPGQRYHPAIIGQAIATLAQMFPGRFWAALGSGEASNERITGEAWPRKEVRDARLLECVDIIRRLLRGEEVSHEGLVEVNRARLWTLPETTPDLVGPAVTPQTAARHAAWADGLITVNQPAETLRRVLDAYRDAGGRGPARLQIHLSWAPSDDEATAIAYDQWRNNVFDPPVSWDIETVEAFDVIGGAVSKEKVSGAVRISADLGRHAQWLSEYVAQGWDELYLHFVGQEQAGFIDAFGEHVLPQLSPTAPAPSGALA
ncbi:TIGR03885 family FMN-dependent LLM class oxidoreductase [Mycolicibacterium parafortuitum]|uniref:Flavin-dependent oxidoreductase, F420-dependent methylene-tetrahydromethanopterin reductase [Modestobacter marinus] n=1 Tax=Mycolicibacterium parafortuitum TaxID=39692 RepID=A0A375YDI1_MYCPF|nr:TIGR03885 family FMN-dependent LLM class oxidoreductase [Mycolicibacterium parafortuitum]ORB31104.1 LLM class F420-dependent oxidoreductase [Mycolicibacterium parafortuitum]SRX79140.1 flavin-dependent oxidoreductase, F420-dependent methylene-tetrahydromethanopterin reductase [Modestobacter marinus] [Mycolicibacterium parafortuitum]